jgi:hypothetical protein
MSIIMFTSIMICSTMYHVCFTDHNIFGVYFIVSHRH